eukprot:TRINITY_DN18091_c0_g1_i2.p1 TRINITY_DN18091_c0_g1~~TRINITY_DN18091_c0_g1_i2.p1  ORF type:complete len:265 (+),score=53.40 TRINITY_DN18091_c0_g1_i2:106-900(+)
MAPKADAPSMLLSGIRSLYEQSLLCDLEFVVNDTSYFAHSVVLSTQSDRLYDFLRTSKQREPVPGDIELSMGSTRVSRQRRKEPVKENCQLFRVDGITHSTAMKTVLDFVYSTGTGEAWYYKPESPQVNEDILRLACVFGLDSLVQRAGKHLLTGLAVTNVVDRLALLSDLQLDALGDKILHLVVSAPPILAAVSQSKEILQHPAILQKLLVRQTTVTGSLPSDSGVAGKRRLADQPTSEGAKRQAKSSSTSTLAAKEAKKGSL